MEQKRVTKAEYIKQFEQDENGVYRYTGPAVRLEEARIKAMRSALIILAVCLVLQVIAGCLPAEAMKRPFYVLLPFGTGIGMTILCIYHLYEIKDQAPDVPAYLWQKHGESMTGSLAVLMVISGLCAAGILVYVLLHPGSGIIGILPALLEAAVIVLVQKPYKDLKNAESQAEAQNTGQL